jgi:hypothetical protein
MIGELTRKIDSQKEQFPPVLVTQNDSILEELQVITAMDKSKCFSSLIAGTSSSEDVEDKLSMCQYLVLNPLQAATALQRSIMLCAKQRRYSGSVAVHSSVRNCFNSVLSHGQRSSTRRFKSAQRFSIGLRSGE